MTGAARFTEPTDRGWTGWRFMLPSCHSSPPCNTGSRRRSVARQIPDTSAPVGLPNTSVLAAAPAHQGDPLLNVAVLAVGVGVGVGKILWSAGQATVEVAGAVADVAGTVVEVAGTVVELVADA